MKLLPILAISSALLLTGCATVDECDPTTGDVSIIKKFNCKFSGSYDQRIEMKKLDLSQEQALNSEFKAVLAAIAAEQSDLNADLATQTANQAALNSSLSRLLSQLKEKTSGQQAIQNEIAAIEKKLTENGDSELSTMEKQLELTELQNKLFSLQSNLGLLP